MVRVSIVPILQLFQEPSQSKFTTRGGSPFPVPRIRSFPSVALMSKPALQLEETTIEPSSPGWVQVTTLSSVGAERPDHCAIVLLPARRCHQMLSDAVGAQRHKWSQPHARTHTPGKIGALEASSVGEKNRLWLLPLGFRKPELQPAWLPSIVRAPVLWP